MFRILVSNASFIPFYAEQMRFAALLEIERRSRSVRHPMLRLAASFALLFGAISILAATVFFRERSIVSALTNSKENNMNLQTLAVAPVLAAATMPAWEAHPLDWSSRCTEVSSVTFVDSRAMSQAEAVSFVDTRVFSETFAECEVNSSNLKGTIVILM